MAFEFIFGVAKNILPAQLRTGQLFGNISFLACEVKFEETKPQKKRPRRGHFAKKRMGNFSSYNANSPRDIEPSFEASFAANLKSWKILFWVWLICEA